MTARLFILQPEPHPARRNCKAEIDKLPDGWRVKVEAPKKTRDQEEKYHAMFSDIARQVPVRGELRSDDDMKRLLFSAFKIDTQNDQDLMQAWRDFGNVRMEPGLRGEIVVFGDQTRRLPKVLASALIEWLYAFGAEHEVVWSEPKSAKPRREHIDADTGEITSEVETA